MSTKLKNSGKNNGKSSQKPSGKNAAIDFAAQPQVNLLPLEILERRGLSALKVRIGYGFGVLLLVVALGYGGVFLEKINAEQRLEDATASTAQLRAEEKKYEVVPLVLGQISTSEKALRDGMYREILWKDYLGALAATVPDQGIIKTIAVSAATPNTMGPALEDNLQEESIGLLEFSVNLEELPDTAAWIKALNEVPGFADARLTSATHFLTADGDETIEFAGSVRLQESIYSHRFEPEEEAEVQE